MLSVSVHSQHTVYQAQTRETKTLNHHRCPTSNHSCSVTPPSKEKYPSSKFISELLGSLPNITPDADLLNLPTLGCSFVLSTTVFGVLDFTATVSLIINSVNLSAQCSTLTQQTWSATDTIHPDTSPLVCKEALVAVAACRVRPAFARPRTVEIFGDGWQL